MFDLLRRNRNIRLLFFAQVVSFCGDWFATVAVLGLVLDATDGAGWAPGLVFVSQSLPGFFGALLGGPTADRYDRRRIMVVVSLLQALAALGFVAAGTGPYVLAFVAQALIAFLASFFGPASSASVPNLVDPADLRLATSLLGATWGAMLAIGAAAGAGFTALFGRTAAFGADAVSFVIAALLIAAIRFPPRTAAAAATTRRIDPVGDVAEALRYARGDRPTLALLSSKFGFGFVSGIVSLFALLSTNQFKTEDWGTGILLAGRGVGVVVGPLVASHLGEENLGRILRACGVSLLVFGAAYLAFAGAPTLWVAAALALVAHLGGGAQYTLSTYGLQARTPDSLRGRVLAGDFALVTLSMSVSYVLAGVLASTIGVRAAIAVLSIGAVAWGSVYLVMTARLSPEVLAAPAVAPTGPSRAGGSGGH